MDYYCQLNKNIIAEGSNNYIQSNSRDRNILNEPVFDFKIKFNKVDTKYG